MQAAIRIPQGTLRNSFVSASVDVSGKGGAARKAAPTLSTPAFLTQKIRDILPEENGGLDAFGINFKGSYKNIEASCKRFCKYTGLKFDFTPQVGLAEMRNLSNLIDYFEALIEPLGIQFFVSKENSYGEEVDELECAVYRPGRELDNTVVIMYVAPARYLSPKSSELFKRFMKFFCQSTCIPLGVIDNRNNFYMDAILNAYEEDFFDDDQDEESEGKKITEAYKEGGEFWNLFDEIGSLPKQDAKKLVEDIEAYRKDCPTEELDFIECLQEGVPIVADMNIYWFDFNPMDDGMPDEYGNSFDEDWSSSVVASAILYSEHDGICDQLLDYINNEASAGINMSEWNIHQYLGPKTKKSDIMKFMRCKDATADFSKWLQNFYRNAEKFDRYGKSEEHTEQ